jgi:anti-anti-sigma factor
MSDAHDSITITTHVDGDSATIELAGELDLHAAGQLSEAITEVLEASPSTIGIDARGLTFADSGGLRELLQGRSDAESRGTTLRLTHLSEALDRLLDMTGLRKILHDPVT